MLHGFTLDLSYGSSGLPLGAPKNHLRTVQEPQSVFSMLQSLLETHLITLELCWIHVGFTLDLGYGSSELPLGATKNHLRTVQELQSLFLCFHLC